MTKEDDIVFAQRWEEVIDLPTEDTRKVDKDLAQTLINEALNQKWSRKDYTDGKEIPVFPEWEPFAEELVWLYRDAGWNVFNMMNGKKHYFSFFNPLVASPYSSKKIK